MGDMFMAEGGISNKLTKVSYITIQKYITVHSDYIVQEQSRSAYSSFCYKNIRKFHQKI